MSNPTHAAARGEVTPDGDHATVTFRRTFSHRIEHVWAAISTPEGVRGWLMASTASIEGRTGGRIEMKSGPSQFHSKGTILAWDPPRVLEYEWNVGPTAEMPAGENAIFRYELAPGDGDTTNMTVTYRRLTARTARGFVVGLHAFLDRLDAQLAGTTPPSFQQRMGELMAEYPAFALGY